MDPFDLSNTTKDVSFLAMHLSGTTLSFPTPLKKRMAFSTCVSSRMTFKFSSGVNILAFSPGPEMKVVA